LVKEPIARVSRRRCSKDFKSRAGVAGGAFSGTFVAGAVATVVLGFDWIGAGAWAARGEAGGFTGVGALAVAAACSVFPEGFTVGFGFVAGLTAEGEAEVWGGAVCDGAVRGAGSTDALGSICFVDVQPEKTTKAAHPIIFIALRMRCNLTITSPPE
jgi:hypothetical protein